MEWCSLFKMLRVLLGRIKRIFRLEVDFNGNNGIKWLILFVISFLLTFDSVLLKFKDSEFIWQILIDVFLLKKLLLQLFYFLREFGDVVFEGWTKLKIGVEEVFIAFNLSDGEWVFMIVDLFVEEREVFCFDLFDEDTALTDLVFFWWDFIFAIEVLFSFILRRFE